MIKVKVKKQNIKHKIISCFVNSLESKDVDVLMQNLKDIGVSPLEAIRKLDREEVDAQFYVNASHMHNEMAKKLGADDSIKIDAFADFPKPDSNDHRTPDKYWMRSPKLPTSTAQLDYRRDRKN
jgi:hypothetical protein